jgi:hypothetical protein
VSEYGSDGIGDLRSILALACALGYDGPAFVENFRVASRLRQDRGGDA